MSGERFSRPEIREWCGRSDQRERATVQDLPPERSDGLALKAWGPQALQKSMNIRQRVKRPYFMYYARCKRATQNQISGNSYSMKLIEKEETESTNNDAKQLAEDGASHLTVVTTVRQTAGRGRHDRKWASFEGNVFYSVIIRPDHNWKRFSDIVYVNALSTLRAVSESANVESGIGLKWPNDVILNSKKVAGSLIESGGAWTDNRPSWIVIGTGINVVAHPRDDTMIYPPTSLASEGYKANRKDLISHLTKCTYVFRKGSL